MCFDGCIFVLSSRITSVEINETRKVSNFAALSARPAVCKLDHHLCETLFTSKNSFLINQVIIVWLNDF